MIADISYPILTLTITILVYFIREKNYSGALHPHLNQGIPQGPLGAYSSPQTPSCNHFWLCQKPMHPFFSVLSPVNNPIIYKFFKDLTNQRKKTNRVVVFSSRPFSNILKYRDHQWDLPKIHKTRLFQTHIGEFS